ncbi:MAG: Fe-S protein assembly co-chaperone HscB [bacterium]
MQVADTTETAKNLCWNCKDETAGAPFCEHCAKIQPAGPGTDFFQFIGLPRLLQIDPKDLERRFYELSRKFHPDFYQSADDYERRLSLENSAILNQAYRALREPFARTEYLVKLVQGFEVEIAASPPHELLEEVFEFNERLQEFQTESDEERRQGLASELENDKRNFEEKNTALRSALDRLFHNWDAESDAGGDTAEIVDELRTLLSQRKYIQNAVRDITEALTCLTSA